MEFSINLFGGAKCNAMCSYCSAHLITEEHPIIDLDAIVKTMKENRDLQKAFNGDDEKVTINLWGGEPLIHIKYFDPIVERLEKEFGNKISAYFISTNGIPLADKNVVKWIYDFNKNIKPLYLQLSHDGLGQYYRTKWFDPLFSESTKDVLVKLAKDGVLSLINCTMSALNPSMFANMFYFNKWLYDNDIPDGNVGIKLNHINDSDYCSEFDFNGEELDTYIHESELIFMDTYALIKKFGNPKVMFRKDGIKSKDESAFPKWWQPFADYFYNQLTRDNLYTVPGGCGQFAIGMRDQTWCINTKGEYIACQLWDTNDGIQNLKLEMPDYCEDCEYKIYNECHPCPNNTYPKEKCSYHKAFIRMILRLKEMRILMDDMEQDIKNSSGHCGCGDGSCNCGENSCEPQCNSWR